MSSPQVRSVEDERALDSQAKMASELPHLFGYRWYQFQIDFINSVNRENLLCAANQIGKSVCSIAKCIHWATDKKLWGALWVNKPKTFAYLYPSVRLATTEFREKWEQDLLPRGDMKNDPVYGWKAHY
jgi:RecA-family ATPase